MFIKSIIVGNTTYDPKTHKLPPLSDLLAHILMVKPDSVEVRAAKIYIRFLMFMTFGKNSDPENKNNFFPLYFLVHGHRALAVVRSTKRDAWTGRQYVHDTNACALAFNETYRHFLKEKLLWQPITYPVGASTLGNKQERQKKKVRPMFIRR